MSERHDDEPRSGIGSEDLEKDQPRPDFTRGSNGAPRVLMPDGRWEQFSRQSGHGDVLEDTTSLTNWRIAKALEGVARDQSILARVIAASPYEDHRSEFTKLREDAINAGRGAQSADIGTAVHLMSERWEQDPHYDPGPQYTPVLQAYSDGLERLGLRSQMFECQFVNRVHRTAGTADRLYELTLPLVVPTGEVLPPGTLIIGDLKTGSLEYSMPGFSVQLAGYAGGSLYDVEAERFLPTPPIHQGWALIASLHIEDATCEFLWVDLEVGRYGARLADEVKEWRRAWRRKDGYMASVQPAVVATGEVPPAPERKFPTPTMSMTKSELLEYATIAGVELDPRATKAQIIEALQNPRPEVEVEVEPPAPAPERQRTEWADDPNVEAWIPWLRERLDAIREVEEAKQWMLHRWTPDLVPPKRCETLEQVLALEAHIARVEREFGLPFVPGRPKVEVAA